MEVFMDMGPISARQREVRRPDIADATSFETYQATIATLRATQQAQSDGSPVPPNPDATRKLGDARGPIRRTLAPAVEKRRSGQQHHTSRQAPCGVGSTHIANGMASHPAAVVIEIDAFGFAPGNPGVGCAGGNREEDRCRRDASRQRHRLDRLTRQGRRMACRALVIPLARRMSQSRTCKHQHARRSHQQSGHACRQRACHEIPTAARRQGRRGTPEQAPCLRCVHGRHQAPHLPITDRPGASTYP